jgi:hypothetical protein
MGESSHVGVPIFIFVLAFAVGSVLPARLLPALAEGHIAGIALLVTCGLFGMVVALVAVHVYEIVRQLDQARSLGLSNAKPDTIANGILTTLRDAGPILGLAAAVYLLAPAPDEDESPTGSRGVPGDYSSEPS